MYRLRIIAEILVRPVWVVCYFLWGAFLNLSDLFSLFGLDGSSVREWLMGYALTRHLLENWGAYTLVLLALSVAEGIYTKSRYYLGETVRTRHELGWHVANSALFVPVVNKEHTNITNANGALQSIYMCKKVSDSAVGGYERIKEISPSATVELMWENAQSKRALLGRNGQGDSLRIGEVASRNQVRIGGVNFNGIGETVYLLTIKINGDIDGKPITEIVWEGYVEFGETGYKEFKQLGTGKSHSWAQKGNDDKNKPLTRHHFIEILNRVVRAKPSKKPDGKRRDKGKKGTSA